MAVVYRKTSEADGGIQDDISDQLQIQENLRGAGRPLTSTVV